ncbi:winged helix DNA-binding domain-containing protein [Aeromicrobium phragmitis]|uniref:Winged helix DNA-binding domain-containing protein n=1 Tax=Aeromicrobium phragmitis TaxID=2478914 RepID=A0A3L8PPF1_9ACTN|nr:winged helix DNA-binding domain-containing protein [Aeromicrobium phragmitis]
MDDAERRRRVGARHALAAPVASTEDAARALVAVHSTDPASMTLAVAARLQRPDVGDVERALYTDRTVVRVLAMRRTVFAVPADLALSCLAATAQSVAGPERRKLVGLLRDARVAEDPEAWLDAAHRAALALIEQLGTFSAGELAAADPLLATQIEISPGTKYATRQSVASRLMTLMSAEGHVVRARPDGAWGSTRFRWAAMAGWSDHLVEPQDAQSAAAEVARRWLFAYGPARPEDLQWWTGWTKRTTTAALAALPTVEIQGDEGPLIALADDLGPTPGSAPWVALLPALDSTTMGWKHRDWYLGPHRASLYDVNGNAGPTVWADGRVVGGWAIRDDGTVAVRLLQDPGSAARDAIDDAAHRLETFLDGTVVKARARGWSPVERELRS